MKAVHVLATYFGNRRNYPSTKYQVVEVLNAQIESLYNLDVGVDCDLLIVNHDIEDPEIYEYLKNLEGIKLKNGVVKILNRPIVNKDLSFGSYKYAFHKFEDEYDYWFFNEDDIINSSGDPVTLKLTPFYSENKYIFQTPMKLSVITLSFAIDNQRIEFPDDNLTVISVTAFSIYGPSTYGNPARFFTSTPHELRDGDIIIFNDFTRCFFCAIIQLILSSNWLWWNNKFF